MRIIAGKWRGRHIAAPTGRETRPILDRAKTVLFDVLGHRLDRPGRLPPLAVLDLFAGSGAMGLEALSRGARYCLFVEQHPPAVAMLRRNLAALQAADEAHVLQADATECAFSPPSADSERLPGYGLVFVDPPYRMLGGFQPARAVAVLLDRLGRDAAIAPDALIVFRHRCQEGAGPDLSPLIEVDRREVGRMVLRFARPARAVPGDPGEEDE